MRRSSRLTFGWWVAACTVGLLASGASAQPAPGDCPPQDLTVVLNTGWDQSTGGAVIPVGGTDDDWDVVVDASGGTTPRDADVIAPNSAWLTLPNSQWISAAATGPNGTYVYEMCWCMDDSATNPQLSFEVRADDEADLLLNGALIAATPAGSFNDTIPTIVNVTDPALFLTGQNCLQVEVRNVYGVVTGFNLAGTMTADDGLCCGCAPEDLVDDGSTGVNDDTGGLIANGADDDEWVVTGSASGGVLPRPAEVTSTFAGWNVIPGTKWITADKNGPNGTYTYEKCWCMDEDFQNAQLAIDLLADDQADVFLNGNPLGSTGPGAFLFPATSLFTSDQSLFRAGTNCVTIDVQNTNSVVTGLNVSMQVTAEAGACCPCVDLPADAEAWWQLNETTGVMAFDAVNAHDGFHSGGPIPVPGYVNGALQFDAIDDYVRVPNAPGLNFGPGQDFSIDAWVRTPSNLRQPIVHHKLFGLPPEPGYSFSAAGNLFFEMADGTNYVGCIGNTFINDGLWHFVAVTVDRDLPGGIRIYVDGVIDQVCDPTPVLAGDLTNSESLYIGGFPAINGFFWEDLLDEIELFRRALTIAEVEELYLAAGAGKCPLVACEDSDGNPTCEGTCDTGETCVVGLGPDPCTCVPETQACGGFQPVCDGLCPNSGDICVTDATGECHCQPRPQCEGTDTWPVCDGECPNANDVCVDTGASCHCMSTNPCEEQEYPICQGDCPDGTPCTPDDATSTCTCNPGGGELPCEGFATYPVCDGFCDDSNEICVNNGQRCHCEPPPHCGDPGDYPVCNGPCPDGFTCEQLGPPVEGCECQPVIEQCSDTFYPECGGECPAGETCKNIVGTDNCQCVGQPVGCGNAPYPECNGLCFGSNQKCLPTLGQQSCSCQTCLDQPPDDPFVPYKPIINMKGDKIRWTELKCALVYNVYRAEGPTLRDLDHDGLADDYGSCYQQDIIDIETTDGQKPPPGSTYWYLVTGENFAGESPLDTNSSGQQRQATTVCP